jgi:hypothetical protein
MMMPFDIKLFLIHLSNQVFHTCDSGGEGRGTKHPDELIRISFLVIVEEKVEN